MHDDLRAHWETPFHLEVYAALGRVVVAWGMVENHFNLNLMFLYHSLGGSSLLSRPPIPFGAKLLFWRKCFKEIPLLTEHQLAADSFADRLDKAAKDRNKVFHFNWIEAISEPRSQSISIYAIDATKNGFDGTRTAIDLSELYDFVTELGALNTILLAFTLTLAKLQSQVNNHPQP